MADDDASSGLSARDRRRERAKANAPGTAGRSFKRYRVHLVIALVFAAIVTAMVVNGKTNEDCPGHWHSTQDVYVNGERISFSHPKFKLEGGQGMPVSSHMHQDSDAQMHFEPSTAHTCIPYGDFTRFIDMDLEPGKLTLDGAHAELGQAGTYRDNSTHTLRAEHCIGTATSCDDWENITISKLVKRQLQPNERVLIHYDNGTADEAAMRQTATSHAIQGSSGGGGGSSLVPAVGVGILGLVVLGAWHAMSRRV